MSTVTDIIAKIRAAVAKFSVKKEDIADAFEQINDQLQTVDEVVGDLSTEFEEAYINSEDLVPGSNNTYDIGSTTRKFRDLYIGRNAIINSITYEGSYPYDLMNNFNPANGNIQTCEVIQDGQVVRFENMSAGVYYLIIKQDGVGHALALDCLTSGDIDVVAKSYSVVQIISDGDIVLANVVKNYV